MEEKSSKVGSNLESNAERSKEKRDFSGHIGVSRSFAQIAKLITRDLNNARTTTSSLRLYSKDDISSYLTDPGKNETKLREAVNYIYGASPHFRRLIQYFVGLSDLAYIVQPFKIDPRKANIKTVGNNYRKVLNMLSNMNIRTQMPKILTVCLREDVYYGTVWITNDGITIQQLPSDYCAISSIEGNVMNVSFNFSYFDTYYSMLAFYPDEFRKKYELYRDPGNDIGKWIELDSPTSFAIKCNSDILSYAIPPFAGILREIYDIEDYKQLKQTKTAIENYALIAMTLPIDEDGNWGIDLDKAEDFWRNLDNVLPEEVGSVLSPMELKKISFERSNTGDTDTVADAEQNLFTAAGVSSLLFNNSKASANALLLSIKADQAMTFGIVKCIEDAINRLIQSQSFGRNFKVTFLDCSPYNREELANSYLKAATYGLPTVSMYAATQGLGQAELETMSFLETEVLNIHDMFKPLKSSTQMSSSDLDSEAATDEGGAPTKGVGEISDSGEVNQENA